MPVPHKYGTTSIVTEKTVDSQSKLHKKSHKKKRRHCQDDLFNQQKHCKYQKVEGDATFVDENVKNVQKEHHNDSSLKKQMKHTSVEKLQRQLLSRMLPGTDNSQQQEKCKKKKNNMNDNGTPYDAECIQRPKHKKKKRSKKVRDDDVSPQSNLSNDNSKHSSSSLPLSNVNNDSGSKNVRTSSSIDSDVLLVSELADASLDEVNFVEHVYKQQKLNKPKHKKPIVDTDVETQSTSECQVVTSEASANLHQPSPTKNLSSEQHLNSKDILNLLHAENSLTYLKNETAVKKAGECCIPDCSLINSVSFILMTHIFLSTA